MHDFIAGRPAWERVGVQMVDSVVPHEEAKIRILNASHSGVAWAGTLRGHRYIHEGTHDPLVRQLAGIASRAGFTEMLLDDSVRAHDRALQAGTRSRIDVWPDMPHVFPLFPMVPEAQQAIRDIVAFIEEHARDVAALPQSAEPRTSLDPALTSGFAAVEPANRGAL